MPRMCDEYLYIGRRSTGPLEHDEQCVMVETFDKQDEHVKNYGDKNYCAKSSLQPCLSDRQGFRQEDRVDSGGLAKGNEVQPQRARQGCRRGWGTLDTPPSGTPIFHGCTVDI